MERHAGLEPATNAFDGYGVEARCSIQLNYARKWEMSWTRLPDSNRGVLAHAGLQTAAFDRSAKPWK